MYRILLFCSVVLFAGCAGKGVLSPADLRCEYLTNPPVVDVLQPRLCWINLAEEGIRQEKQTSYQLRVASDPALLDSPDLWDSGKMESERSTRIPYGGKTLKSRQECWWQVRVWDSENRPSDWSEPAHWRMGILNASEWEARWIGAPWQGEEPIARPGWPDKRPEAMPPPAPMFRKDFLIEKELRSAVAFVSGLGYFEMYLNGDKVGEDVLVPNQTNYGKRTELEEALIHLPDNFRDYKVMYLAYDIKDRLTRGENTLGALLGNGFYNPAKFWAAGYGTPRFLLQLHLEYADGSEEVILSDPTWKASRSPILMDMVYWGETYDARLEQPGWSSPGFDDSDWELAMERKAPEGRLAAHTAHPDRVTERFKPLSIEKLGEGHYRVDFGTEISGWVRLKGIDGPEGQEVQLRFNGNLYSGDNQYVCSGRGPTDYAPRFNWFVFSGVEIEGWPGELKKENLVAEMVNTYIEPTARFETSSELFNQINTVWRRSQVDNMHGGVASDCPHRERSPYTGDGQVACTAVLHNYDARNFYQKWVQDILGSQIVETGYVPNGSPWQPGCGGGPAWGAAICVIPWEYYLHYGSIDMLEGNFEGMRGYVGYMLTWTGEDGIMHSQRTARDGSVLKWFNLGEWVPPGEMIPEPLVHTFYLWYCAKITSETAGILGMKDEEEHYRELAERTRLAFQKRFFNEETGSYGDGGGNILALFMGVPATQYDRVVLALKRGLQKSKGHLDTGIIGTRFFFEVLAENGLNREAFEAMSKRTEPSFGRWIELGSTTTREHWSESGSFNHPMFGGGLGWFYRYLAGMQVDPSEPGYKHIIFKPHPVDELSRVSYSNTTVYGMAGITWLQEEGSFSMELTVPVGCHATVFVPADDPSSITEGGRSAQEVDEITLVETQENYVVFRVGSGEYVFRTGEV